MAHLMAMRSAVDAIILELTEEHEGQQQTARCCEAPCYQRLETYGGGVKQWCSNCGTDKVSGEQ
jgi:hypothetical protein